MKHKATLYFISLDAAVKQTRKKYQSNKVLPKQIKEVLSNEVNTRIDCGIGNSSAVNITWHYNGNHLPTSFIDGIEECNTTAGIFQLHHRPSSLIICKMNQTVHNGVYTCHAPSHNESKSRDTLLMILGNIILTF